MSGVFVDRRFRDYLREISIVQGPAITLDIMQLSISWEKRDEAALFGACHTGSANG